MEECTRCGTTLPVGHDAFCPECGKEFGVPEPVPLGARLMEATGEASKERFLAAWMDSFLAVAAGLVAAGAFPRYQEAARAATLGVVYLGYFFLSEWLAGGTPGKLLFGLRVRRLDGGRCSWWQAGVRTAFRLIEVNPALLGALPAGIAILASRRHQRLGDMWAGTVVVSREAE